MKKFFFLFAMLMPTVSIFAQGNEYDSTFITFETQYQYLKIDTSSQNI